jgi:short-subunit dehydrogenase
MFVYRSSTALVTGASKGLGEVFADALAARGMNLVLVARSVDALQRLAERLTAKYDVQCVALNAGSQRTLRLAWFGSSVPCSF